MRLRRTQVIAYRIAAQGLHRDGRLDGVLDLGLQDTGTTAALALAARGAQPGLLGGLDLGWTLRGAPHHHRDHAGIARAARPLGDDDAAARLNWNGPDRRRIGIAPLEAIERTADALDDVVVTEPSTKGAVSRRVTERLPAQLLRDCKPCGCVHVNEQLLRIAALPAGIGLDTAGRTLLLTPPPPGWVRPAEADVDAAAGLVVAYLRVLGPATSAEVAGFVGTSATALRPAWEAALPRLAEVEIDGKRAWLPAEDADAAADPPAPDVVRLLPPYDPFLQLRDRALLVPDADRRAELYRALGNPGAVLAGGEIAGTWRMKASGRTLTITVDGEVTPAVREEAERVAAARGLALRACEHFRSL